MRHVLASALLLTVALTGCEANKETFILERLGDGVDGYSAGAKQRFVWLPEVSVRELKQDGATAEAHIYEPRIRPIICAEPSPDALSALAARLNLRLDASKGDIEAGAGFDRSVSEAVQNLTERTEMIQLLRDGYYRACEGYANGMIGEFGYGLILNQLDDLILRMSAVQVLAEQRPLPAKEADRQKLAKAEAEERAFALAEKSHDAAVWRLKKIDLEIESLERVRRDLPAKDEASPTQKAQIERIEENLAALREEQKTIDGDLKTFRSTLDSLGQRLVAAKTDAATVPGELLSSQAVAAIAKLVDGVSETSKKTTKGACLMWFSQHLGIRAKHSPDEPALATFCRAVIAASVADAQLPGWALPPELRYPQELRK